MKSNNDYFATSYMVSCTVIHNIIVPYDIFNSWLHSAYDITIFTIFTFFGMLRTESEFYTCCTTIALPGWSPCQILFESFQATPEWWYRINITDCHDAITLLLIMKNRTYLWRPSSGHIRMRWAFVDYVEFETYKAVDFRIGTSCYSYWAGSWIYCW